MTNQELRLAGSHDRVSQNSGGSICRYLIGYHDGVATMGPTTTGHVERLAGNVLRIARARAGLSQRELAEAAHVPQSTIARIESGTRQPSLPVLARILAAIDLELRITVADYDAHDDILDGDVARRPASQRRDRRRAQEEFVAQLREAQRS